jgi:uncharacterized membrane protein
MFLTEASSFVPIRRNYNSNHKQTMTQLPTKSLFAVALLAVGIVSIPADVSKLPPAATKTGVTFATDIKPIFEASCTKCHGEERPKAGLKLTTLETTLKGSRENKVVEPGNAAKSSLLLSVAHIGEDDTWMPPKDNKAKIAPLTKEQVALVRAWVEQGAK